MKCLSTKADCYWIVNAKSHCHVCSALEDDQLVNCLVLNQMWGFFFWKLSHSFLLNKLSQPVLFRSLFIFRKIHHQVWINSLVKTWNDSRVVHLRLAPSPECFYIPLSALSLSPTTFYFLPVSSFPTLICLPSASRYLQWEPVELSHYLCIGIIGIHVCAWDRAHPEQGPGPRHDKQGVSKAPQDPLICWRPTGIFTYARLIFLYIKQP